MGFVHLQWLNEASVLRISMFIYLVVLGWSPGLSHVLGENSYHWIAVLALHIPLPLLSETPQRITHI